MSRVNTPTGAWVPKALGFVLFRYNPNQRLVTSSPSVSLHLSDLPVGMGRPGTLNGTANAMAWDTFGTALGHPMGRSKSPMFSGVGTAVRLIYPPSARNKNWPPRSEPGNCRKVQKAPVCAPLQLQIAPDQPCFTWTYLHRKRVFPLIRGPVLRAISNFSFLI